jgi:uroporphyrinogen decarboxylase
MAVVDDLIEAGMDVLDPVQPGALDIEEVSRAFGGRVSFCGAIDIQHLLCEGTPAQVRDEVLRTIDVLGRRHGDGLIVGPANVVTPEVPLANLRALFAACHER